ncbi:uncharacterized protein STEHIDRAFT_163368 [Stereum hirsutum FP-91666 SS1]|uniref:Uncharacterized protein n=1 Tax=Stereum hirsutum (strain FP-91666) TaxID=721885 RepID=R7RWV5_STEHR|nr:uncharacterized protein STEHIDRAFT_163368 [Stereum hirsutum FP-91666 SS1]EIM79809.1 hypothetical protein STEHIDRAFT_163368 [Stereum hirsutum FP-91666 SS1]
MSSALYTAVPTTLSSIRDYPARKGEIGSFLDASGLSWVLNEPNPRDSLDAALAADRKAIHEWVVDDTKAKGSITLRLDPTLRESIKDQYTTATELMALLKKKFDIMTLGTVFNDFSDAMKQQIPGNSNPDAAIDKITMLFNRLKLRKVEVPEHLIAMIILSKLPPRYKNVLSNFSQMGASDIISMSVEKVCTAAVNDFIGTGKSAEPATANKLSTVKRKQNDPNFSQQQRGNNQQQQRGNNQQQRGRNQQQQQGNSGNNGNQGDSNGKKKRKRGKKGKGQNGNNAAVIDSDSDDEDDGNTQNSLQFAPINEVLTFGPPRTDLDPSTRDVRRHSKHPAHRPSNASLRIHKKVKKGIELAHELGVKATPDVICALEPCGHISEVESDDEGDAGPSQKRMRTLADRIAPAPDAENGITAPTPPHPSTFGYEDFGELPPSPAFPPLFDTPISLGDPDEPMTLDLDAEIADIAGILGNMGETRM